LSLPKLLFELITPSISHAHNNRCDRVKTRQLYVGRQAQLTQRGRARSVSLKILPSLKVVQGHPKLHTVCY